MSEVPGHGVTLGVVVYSHVKIHVTFSIVRNVWYHTCTCTHTCNTCTCTCIIHYVQLRKLHVYLHVNTIIACCHGITTAYDVVID